jgi:hypothetical protein
VAPALLSIRCAGTVRPAAFGGKEVTTEFVYSLTRSDLVLRREADALLAALRCRTWGALARCAGLSWEQVRQRVEPGPASPDAPFDVVDVLTGGPGAELMPDPFRAAAREFRTLAGDLSWHPVVLRHMEYGTGIAGSSGQTLSYDHEDGLKQVESVLRQNRCDVVFVRDESLFARLDLC